MKTAPLIALLLLVAVPVRAQVGTDTKAKLAGAVASAQKAYESGNLDQAEEALKAVGTAVHDDAAAVMLRARINFDLGEFGKAATYATRAADLSPNDAAPRVFAGRSLFQQAETAKNDRLASMSRISGFYEAAVTEFDKALKLKPDSPEVLSLKAQCLVGLDRVPEAIVIFEAMKKSKPDDPEAYLRLAQVQLAANDYDAALKSASDGLVTKGQSGIRGDLASIVFNVLNKAGKFAEMYAAFKAWNTAHPNDPLAYLWMGYARFMEKSYDEAIAHYQKGFEVSGKKHGGLALELGNAYAQRNDAKKGDLDKAAEAYGAALKAQPEWPNYEAGPMWRLLGLSGTFAQKLDYAKAIEILEKNAMPAGNDDWHVTNNLGLFYRDWADRIDRSHKSSDAKAKNEKSLAWYQKAAQTVLTAEGATPKNKAQVLNDLGVIHDYQLGNMEKGLEFYRQALGHDATYIDALENLGLCFNKLGKYEEAIPLFEKVLAQEGGRAVSRRGLSEAKKAVDKDQKPASR